MKAENYKIFENTMTHNVNKEQRYTRIKLNMLTLEERSRQTKILRKFFRYKIGNKI